MPPDESPYLHTKFHFEFHSFKEETLFVATPQSHFVRQLPVNGGAFWGTLCAKIYELTLRLEQGRLTHCRSQFSLFLPVLRFAYSSTGRAQLRTSRSDCFNGVTGAPGGLRGEIEISPGPLAKKGYNVALGSMFVLTPSENSLTANFQLPLRGSLLVYFINSCDKPPSPREEDFAKQKTEGVGLPPQFSPNR